LTEKGLFSRKAIAEGPKVRLTLRWREVDSNLYGAFPVK